MFNTKNVSGYYDAQILFDQAQGSRSLRRFASELEADVSMLSRIRSGLIRPKDELLKKIVDHAEKPDRITFEEIKKAFEIMNAQIKRTEQNRLSPSKQDVDLRSIVSMGLISRGYSITGVKESPFIVGTGSNYHPADFVVITNALNGLEKTVEKTWAFDFLGRNKSSRSVRNLLTATRIIERIKVAASEFYFGQLTYSRFSVATDDEEAFETVKKRLKTFTAYDELSVILININEKTITEEYIIPKRDGENSISPFEKEQIL